jgi:hypothetical protein
MQKYSLPREPYGIGLFGNDLIAYDYLNNLNMNASFSTNIDKYSSLNLPI